MIFFEAVKCIVVDDFPCPRVHFSDHRVRWRDQHGNSASSKVAENPFELVTRGDLPWIAEELDHFISEEYLLDARYTLACSDIYIESPQDIANTSRRCSG